MSSKSNAIIDIRDVKKVLTGLRDNLWIIIVFLVISLVAAYLYSYKLPRIYASKAQMLLKNDETYSYQEGLFQGLGIYGGGQYEKMANEQKVLLSSDLISQTIARLKMDVSYYIVGRIQTKEVFSGTPFQVEAQLYNTGYYEFPFTLKIIDIDTYEISFEEGEQQTKVRHKFGDPLINSNYYFLIHKTNALNKTTIESFKEITYQYMIHDRDNLLYKYKAAIKVENFDYTAILEVTMEDESMERTISFLDTLSKVYINNSFKTRLKVNENTINFIDKQLGEVITIIDSIENILEDFKQQKDIIDLPREESSYYSYFLKYDGQKRSLELQLKTIDYLKKYITSNLNKELLPPSIYNEGQDGYLTTAINQLYSLQVQINNTLFSSTDNSTTVKEIEYKIELLRTDILKYLINSEQAIRQKIESVEGEIDYYEGMMKGVPRNQKQILNINRKLSANEKMYVYLLEKRAETVIAKAGIIPNISLVETAHSIGVVKPDLNKIYYSFMSAGLLIALIIAFFRTIFFGKIESIEELREMTHLPVIGEVMHSKESKGTYLIADTQIRSLVAESFRAIRTNLEYLAPEIKSKVVLITSNMPSAGKTFCSVNLGAMLAKGGKRVLLIEMDLHKPKIHTAFGFENKEGMSGLLIGKTAIPDAIRTTSVENLDVILAGPIPPNASELILSPHLSALLEYAKKQYDYIVVDTPPLGIISDALALMKHSDINLFIISTTHGSKEGLQFAHNTVANNSIKSFAFILNNVGQKRSKYYYKNYQYAYGQYNSDLS